VRAQAASSAAPPFIAAAGHAIVGERRRAVVPPPIAPRSPVPAFEFSTLDLPSEEQFGAWRDSFAPILTLDEPDDRTEGFAGTQIAWDLGNLAFARIKTDALSFASLAGHSRRDPIDHWLFTLVLEGSFRTITPSRTLEGGPRSVQMHPLGGVFEGCVTDSEMLLLFVPRDFCRDMSHLLDAAAFSTLGRGMGQLFADHMISLARRLRTLDAADLPRLASATRTMILACVAPSLDNLEHAQEPITTVLLERARRFVQTNLFNPDLDATIMQRELGMSRSRLYRLFEPSGGVAHYIQHRRLLDAHAALADANDRRRIVEIAQQYGFNDGAEFSRAFRREFGYSPSEVRTGGKINAPRWSGAGLQTTAPCDRLGVLLRRLQA